MSMNYDITKEVPKFDGTKIEEFEAWLSRWEAAEEKLNRMEKSEGEKLLALKRCLKGRAFDYIKNVREGKDANFEGAKRMLVEYYLDKQTSGKVMVDRLLELPAMTRESDSIESGFFELRGVWESLQGLNLTGSQGRTLLFCAIAETKMNPSLKKAWAKKMEQKADPTHPIGHAATEDDLFSVMSREIKLQRSLEKSISQEKGDSKREEKRDKDRSKGTIQGSFPVARRMPVQSHDCLICKKNGHGSPDCFRITNLRSGQERVKFLDNQKINLCRNCLKGRHPTSSCRQDSACQKCGSRHHTLLHYEKSRVATASVNKPLPQKQPEKTADTNEETVAAAIVQPAGITPILQSCMAWVLSPSGEKALARIFFDSGSEITLIRRELTQKLGLDGPCHKLRLTGVGGISLQTTSEKRVKFRLESLAGDYTSHPIEAVTKEKLTEKLREIKVDLTKFPHLHDIHLADELPRSQAEVDVLIGIDQYSQLVTGPSVTGEPNEPVAVKTKLGFVLSGTA